MEIEIAGQSSGATQDELVTEAMSPSSNPIEYHEHIAAEWDQRYAKKSFRSREVAFADCLPSPGVSGVWLDAGCGTGFFGRWLAERGAVVESVDLAPTMVAVASRHRKQASSQERLHEPRIADINSLPFGAGHFDGVLCSSVLEYVDSPAAALHEVQRVLKPGGWLVISVPNRESIVRRLLESAHAISGFAGRAWPEYLDWSIHRYTKVEFEQTLRQSGFSARKFAGCGTSLPGIKRTAMGWSLLVFGAIKLA